VGRRTLRLAAGAVAAGVVLLGAGCTANAPGGHASPASAVSQALPVPFTVTARYTAKMLGPDHPDALAIGPDGNLYVTDLSQRVSVISPSGTVLRRWGRPGRGPGEFQFIAFDPTTPADIHGKIAVGPGGLVYVADSGNSRVQVFTPQGGSSASSAASAAGRDSSCRHPTWLPARRATSTSPTSRL
jgi:DNA-binding beta-propeller fold protein YncE